MFKSIRKKEIVKRIFKEGKIFDGTLFKIHYLPSDGDGVYYALSVSKKLGIAVKRNRAKRLVRAALRDILKVPILVIIRLKNLDFCYHEAVKELDFFKKHINNKIPLDFHD